MDLFPVIFVTVPVPSCLNHYDLFWCLIGDLLIALKILWAACNKNDYPVSVFSPALCSTKSDFIWVAMCPHFPTFFGHVNSGQWPAQQKYVWNFMEGWRKTDLARGIDNLSFYFPLFQLPPMEGYPKDERVERR